MGPLEELAVAQRGGSIATLEAMHGKVAVLMDSIAQQQLTIIQSPQKAGGRLMVKAIADS